MSQLKIYLFGTPRITCNGQRIEISLNKARALLAYLAHTRQAHSRESLASLLWPEVDRSTGLGYLRRALYRVNRALGVEVLNASRKVIEFNPEPGIWVDSVVFQEQVSGCLPASPLNPAPAPECSRRLKEAVELYTADFLAGFSLPDSLAFDEWQFFQLESLRRSYVQTLEALIQSHRVGGEWEAAITCARRWLALDRLDEAAQRNLMALYVESGRPAAALRQYESCCRLLAQELGVAPAEETQALYEQIRQGKPRTRAHSAGAGNGQHGAHPGRGATASDTGSLQTGHIQPDPGLPAKVFNRPGPVHNLPVQANPFIGRDQELDEIRRWLVEEPCCRLLTITGPGGIGKTRLAVEAALASIRSFPDGITFVPLAALSTPDELLSAIAEKLELGYYDGGQIEEQLKIQLRGKQLLLVLDNFEHLLPAAALVGEILESAPQVKILVTARERLKLSPERVYNLQGMHYPRVGGDRDVLEYGAAQLLIHYARLARPDLELHERDYPDIARICRLVQGMPLALVLAAGWLELLSFAEIAAEISASLDFLAGQLRDLPERQRSVRVSFDYSWRRLAAADRQAFARLSIFRGGFTRQAAREVAEVDLRMLRLLMDKSLVIIRSDGRYEIHELLRQYGDEKLQATQETRVMLTAHTRYYLEFLARRQADLKGNRQLAALNEIEDDLGNIRAAWNRAVQERDSEGLDQALESLYLFFTFRSRYAEGIELIQPACQRLADELPGEPRSIYGRLLNRLSGLQMLNRSPGVDIENQLEQGLELAPARAEIALNCLQRGCFQHLIQRDPEAALRSFEQCLVDFQALEDPFYTASTLHWLGSCHALVTSLAEFIQYTHQSLELARSSGNQVLVPFNLRSLTLGTLLNGDYTAAMAYCQEALWIDLQMGRYLGLAESKAILGLIHLLLGDLPRAYSLTEEGLELARQVGFTDTLAHALAARGLVCAAGGEAEVGIRLCSQSLELPVSLFGGSLAHWGLALAQCDLGQPLQAWEEIRRVLLPARQLKSVALAAWTLPVAACLLGEQGRYSRAVELSALLENRLAALTGWREVWQAYQVQCERQVEALSPGAYEAAWQHGAGIDIDLVVEEILAGEPERIHSLWISGEPSSQQPAG